MSENRDDEWRQRQMDFILEQQAQFTVDIQLIKETIAAHSEQIAAHSEQIAAHSEQIAAQAAASAAEFGQVKERMTRAEQLLYASLEDQDSLRREIRNLTTVTDRIGDAVAFLIDRDAKRGNGTNGTGGSV